MGVLAPLYLAGLLALSVPLVLHLIRRTPRGRQEFSSLMFLSPTPPRLTRRSRLDQILLLLMRLAALALLAIAFARPFLREMAGLSLSGLPARKVAILLDTSASMRAGDLWSQALKQIDVELADLTPQDEVALYTYADRLEAIVPFEQQQLATSRRDEVIRAALKDIHPGWQTTDLGGALMTLASELSSDTDADDDNAEPQIILISDLQQGSRIDALQAFEWPQDIRVIPRPLATATTTNAALQLIADEEEPDPELPRVRVLNTANSRGEQFYLRWASDLTPDATAAEVAVYVPPGQSRVVRLPRTGAQLTADRILLRGDDHDFDNTYFVAPSIKQDVVVAYLGDDAADDPQGMQYYFRLAVAGDPLRNVTVKSLAPKDTAELLIAPAPQLVVVTGAVNGVVKSTLDKYLDAGGMVFVAPSNADAAESLPAFFPDIELVEKPEQQLDYLLLGEIDFSHPLFATFANPRYSDFTKIHFWEHRATRIVNPAGTRVIARFDTGEPALFERTQKSGRLLGLTSGWRPEESQLALSSKFVPLMGGVLDQAIGAMPPLTGAVVGADVGMPPSSGAQTTTISTPAGKTVRLQAGATEFTAADEPGIYHAEIGDGQADGNRNFRFAVNLNPTESNTAPLDPNQLEQLGVRFTDELSLDARVERMRQQRDTELEGSQQIWRWLVVAALILLIFETYWASRNSRRAPVALEAVA